MCLNHFLWYFNPADCGAVTRRFPDDPLHENFSSCSSSSRPSSRFKEEPYEHLSISHNRPQSHLHNPIQGSAEARKLSKDSAERAEMAAPCRLLSKDNYDQPRVCQGLQHLSQNIPMQMMLEQKRRLHMTETQYNPQGQQQSARGHLDSTRDDERTVLKGQTPYVPLNLHHVLAKHSSFPAVPYSLGHLSDSYSYRGEEINPYLYRGQSPNARPSPENHGQISHYIGTSVIISNERWHAQGHMSWVRLPGELKLLYQQVASEHRFKHRCTHASQC